MNFIPTKLTILLIILLFSFGVYIPLKAQSERSKALKELEEVLNIDVNFKTDTIALKKRLDSVRLLADERRSIPLKWAYYQLMADGYSIAFDRVNNKSNEYYAKAQELVEFTREFELQQLGYIRQGYYYYVYRNIKEAFPCFLKANDLKEKIDPDEIPRITLHYGFIASFYSFIGDQKKASDYLKAAFPYSEHLSRNRIDMVNAIAVYNLRDSAKDEAFRYFEQALDIAEQAKDSVWIGIVSGNLSDREWEKGNYNKAIALVKKNIEYSNKFNEPLDAMRANLILASRYVKLKDLDSARKYVHEAKKGMSEKPYFLQYKTDAYKVLADIAHGSGNQAEELKYLNTYLKLKDSLDNIRDQEKFQKVSWQWEAEKYQQNLENAELKRKQINQTYFYVVVFFVLLFAIILLLVNRSKNEILFKNTELEKEQLQLSYEKQLVDQELIVLNNSLQEFTATIKQNDLTIQRLRNEVIHNLDHFPDRQEKFNNSLNKMLENQLMTDERWIKFKNIFDRVYPGYLDNEKDSVPKLTEYDLRLLALMKLGLTNRSIGDLLGISLEGVKKAKQRLKKKMDVDSKSQAGAGNCIG